MADIWDSLEADYGGAQATDTPVPISPAPQVTGDIWDSLESDFGTGSISPPEPMGYGDAALSLLKEAPSNIWSGIKKAPGALYDTVASIPSGVSNLVHFPGDALTAAVDATSQGYSALSGEPYVPAGLSSSDNDIIRKALSGETLTPEEILRKDVIKNKLLPDAASGSAEQYARGERTARGVGLLGATIASGGTALGPVVGGAAGMSGFNQLNQAVGNDSITDPLTDLQELEENIGTFGAITGGAKALVKTAKALPELANQLDRKSIGTRQSDYGSTSDLGTIETPAGVPETYVKAQLNDLLENGKLGTSRNPGKVLKIVDESSKKLSSEIDTIIKGFDDSGATAPHPEFANALQYIYDGKVPANEVPSYIKRLDALDKGIAEQGDGKLSYLQQQKIATGKNYSTVDAVKAGFEREIYKDLQTTIEKVVPEVKGLNAELSKYIQVKPIISRALKAAENKSVLTQAANIGFTTGGVGASAIAGGLAGGPLGTLLGAVLGLSTKAIASPGGQALIARVLRSPTKALQTIGSVMPGGLGDAASSGQNLSALLSSVLNNSSDRENTSPDPLTEGITNKQERPKNMAQDRSKVSAVGSTSVNSTLSTNPKLDTALKTVIGGEDMDSVPVQVLEEIKKDPVDHTIMLMESDGDPNAKNPLSTASGLYQLVKGTAKNLGVKDVFDPKENYEGYKKLKEATIKRFGSGDVETVYASHYLGETVLQKLIDGEPLTKEQKDQVATLQNVLLPRLRKIYERVLKEREQVTQV